MSYFDHELFRSLVISIMTSLRNAWNVARYDTIGSSGRRRRIVVVESMMKIVHTQHYFVCLFVGRAQFMADSFIKIDNCLKISQNLVKNFNTN